MKTDKHPTILLPFSFQNNVERYWNQLGEDVLEKET